MASSATLAAWGGYDKAGLGSIASSLSWCRTGRTDTASVRTWHRVRTLDLVTASTDFESGETVAGDQVLGVRLLRVLPERKYRLLCPLPLTLYRAHSYYWVAPDRFVLHGVGATPEDAVEDYGYALIGYFEDLRSQREILAPHLAEHLKFLENIIAEE
jgi:hypothetical protein